MDYAAPRFITSTVDTGFYPEDEETKELYKEVSAFARQGRPIVIFGPSGAGKEFLARHYYRTLIETDFYKQWKKDWPEKIRKIQSQYSRIYPAPDLKVFMRSLKGGIFHSINSATIYPHLAESILFGHERDAFTGANSCHPGLLEFIKCGVLFMDEIGELPKHIQAKLLRAVDTEIAEGSRISGEMVYSLKDLIIISATNQPRGKLRDDYYYRMGAEVTIKGIDERPKDIVNAIPFFISKAIGKRKDFDAIKAMFGVTSIRLPSDLAASQKIIKFAEEQCSSVGNDILIRKWPGNFRALRVVIEASIFRIETARKLADFTRSFRENLKHYIEIYSEDRAKTSSPGSKSSSLTVYPGLFPDMDRRIQEELNNRKSLQDIDDYEKKVLSLFLSSRHENGFTRKDMEACYKEHHVQYVSEPHIRNKIKKLLKADILKRLDRGKSTRYRMTDYFLRHIKNDDIFALPDVNNIWAPRDSEIADLSRRLLTIQRIYIQARVRCGKTSFIAVFCQALQKQYNFCYYALGEGGLDKFFEDIFRRLKAKDDSLDQNDFMIDVINDLNPYLEDLFNMKNGKQTVLILDNVHLVSSADDMSKIVELARRWGKIILILIGDKMDNTFVADFTEFPIKPFNETA